MGGKETPMRTKILKKVLGLTLATLLAFAALAGMTFSTSAVDAPAADSRFAGSVVGSTEVAEGTIGRSLMIWGMAGKTIANAVNWQTGKSSDGNYIIGVNGNVITINFGSYGNATNRDSVWLTDGFGGLTLAFSTAGVVTKTADVTTTVTGLTVGKSSTVTLGGVDYTLVLIGMPSSMTALDALKKDGTNSTKAYTKFYGYDFSITPAGGSAYKYSAEDAITADTNGVINFAYANGKFPSASSATFTATGGALSAKAETALLNTKTFALSKTYSTTMDLREPDTTGYKTNSTISFKVTEGAAAALSTGDAATKNDKIDALFNGTGNITITGLPTGSDTTYTARDWKNGKFVPVVNIFIGKNAIPAAGYAFTIKKDDAIAAEFKGVLKLYDQTFIVPLKDGSYTFITFKVRTSMDNTVVLNRDSITSFRNELRREMTNYVFLDGKAVDGTNRTIIIDMIMGRAGQNPKYFNYDTGAMIATGTDYTKLSTLISYVGYNGQDNTTTSTAASYVESQIPQAPMGYANFYKSNEIIANFSTGDAKTTALENAVKGLYDGTTLRLAYTLGGEDTTIVFMKLSNGQRFDIAFDNNTYAYGIFFMTPQTDMEVKAVGTGYGQKIKAAYEKVSDLNPLGNWRYTITNALKDTGGGFAIGNLQKTASGASAVAADTQQVNPVIRLTNYYNTSVSTDGMNPNATDAVVSLRVPKGTKVTVGTSSGCVATPLNIQSGLYGNTASDGLVDEFVSVKYFTFQESSFVLRLTYVNGVYKDFTFKTTFAAIANDVTSDAGKAYAAFSNGFGDTLATSDFAYGEIADRIAAYAFPSNPNATQSLTSEQEEQLNSDDTSSEGTIGSSDTSSKSPDMGNPFNALAYIITIGATSIGGISTLIIRKKK